MKLTKLLIILSFVFVVMSCIERQPRKDYDANVIGSVDNVPRVIRDTIVIRDTVVKEARDVAQIQEPAPAPLKAKVGSRVDGFKVEQDDYDRSNSGFFDQYLEDYKGDPNKDKKPTTTTTTTVKTIKSDVNDIERKKDAIERSLELLEQKNQQEQERYDQLEKERQDFNEKSLREAREEQKKQTQQKSQPRGKTLDTDLFLNKKK